MRDHDSDLAIEDVEQGQQLVERLAVVRLIEEPMLSPYIRDRVLEEAIVS